MKRVLCAALLLVLILGITWCSSYRLWGHFEELEHHLKSSIVAHQSLDYPASNAALDSFDAVLEENKLFLHLFVRRDVLYSLKNANATLRAYMPDETKQDFYADAARALVQLEAVRDTLFYHL